MPSNKGKRKAPAQSPVSDSEFQGTPPPDEDFGDYGDEGAVEAIKSVEYTTLGDTFYEIQWRGWARPDGTDTTWERGPLGEGYEDALSDWDATQRSQQADAARASSAIELARVTWLAPGVLFPLADVRAAEEAQALKQKLAARDADALRADVAEMNMIMGHTPLAAQVPAGRKPLPPPASSRSASHRLDSEALSGGSPAASSSSSGDAPRRTQPRRGVPLHHPIRDQLNRDWAVGAREAEAADIRFVNNVDDEDAPILANFQYLEHKYDVPHGTPANLRQTDRLVGCTCDECPIEGCLDSGVYEDAHSYVHCSPAYDSRGLYKDVAIKGIAHTVVECNSRCTCGSFCPNRVAQKPRSVPLEIFKGKCTGWGVRSSRELPRGKVVGIFTGKLIPRTKANHIKGERRLYVFDLDTQEEQEGVGSDSDDIVMLDAAPSELWSVDAYETGNWSRFLNHSCAPNMKAYSVVWDTVTSSKVPYLAFATTKKIPPLHELTIDYHPGDTTPDEEPDSDDENWLECQCGVIGCRRWLPLP